MQAAPAPPPTRHPITVTVPASTIVTVLTIDSIDSKTNQAGEVFKASLDAPIVADNRVIVPAGAGADIKQGRGRSAGRVTGPTRAGAGLDRIGAQRRAVN